MHAEGICATLHELSSLAWCTARNQDVRSHLRRVSGNTNVCGGAATRVDCDTCSKAVQLTLVHLVLDFDNDIVSIDTIHRTIHFSSFFVCRWESRSGGGVCYRLHLLATSLPYWSRAVFAWLFGDLAG